MLDAIYASIVNPNIEDEANKHKLRDRFEFMPIDYDVPPAPEPEKPVDIIEQLDEFRRRTGGY